MLNIWDSLPNIKYAYICKCAEKSNLYAAYDFFSFTSYSYDSKEYLLIFERPGSGQDSSVSLQNILMQVYGILLHFKMHVFCR